MPRLVGGEHHLWIAHFLTQKTGIAAQLLMSDRKAAGSWKSVVSQKKIAFPTLGGKFKTALAAGAADKLLAAIITDQMLATHLNAKPAEIKKLRNMGATTKEVILSTFLSFKSGRKILDHYTSVTKEKSSWDLQLNSVGIIAKDVELEIKKIMKK